MMHRGLSSRHTRRYSRYINRQVCRGIAVSGIVFFAYLLPAAAYAQSTPPADNPANAAQAATQPTPATAPTLPKVHFVAADAPSLPEFTVKEGDVDVLAMQAALKSPTHPEDNALEKNIRAVAIDFLTARRATDEPSWSDGLNPMVWVPRTLKGTGAWWQALRAIAPADRPVFEGLPFLWEDGTPVPPATPVPAATPAASPSNLVNTANPAPTPTPPPAGAPMPAGVSPTSTPAAATASATPPPAELTTSERLNNFGLTALLEKGDINIAADLLGRALTANKKNVVAAYNGGLLQMALHNRLECVRLFVRATTYATANPTLTARTNAYLNPTVALDKLLKKPDGSARRLYDESIDTSWALLNGEQYDLAAYVAGQGVVLDPGEARSEAPLLIAMCYARQGKKDKCIKWLTEAFGRYQKTDAGRTELLNLIRQARGMSESGK